MDDSLFRYPAHLRAADIRDFGLAAVLAYERGEGDAIEKANPYHRGSGPGGGQFTDKEHAGGTATAGVRDAATATAPASGGRRLDRKFGAFHDAETRILRQRDHETGMVLERADGTPGPSRDGQARSVEYTPEEVADMKGAVFSHNHPSGSAFSPDDMAMMVQGQLREMRAVGIAPDGRGVLYRARPPADIDARIEALTTTLEAAPRGSEELYIGRKMRQTLRGESGFGGRIIRRDGSPVEYRGLLGIAVAQRQQSFIVKANAYYTSKWSRRVKSGMTEDEATRLTAHEHYHRAVQKVARELGIAYTRTYFALPPEAEIEKALPDEKPETGVRFIDGGFMLWDGLPDYAALAEELDLPEVEGDDDEDDEEVEVEKIGPPTILYPGAGLDVPRRTNPPLSDAGQQRRAEAAGNYRRALEEGNREALARIFRDRRSDRLIQRLIDGDATLDAEQIDRLVEHYERRYGRHLANVEDITAQRIKARDQLRGAWERLVNRPDLDRRRVTKTWITAQDEKVRDAHAAMDGMTIPFDALFPAPDTGDIWAPPQAYNCRCYIRLSYEDAPVEAPLGEEYEWPMPSGEEPPFEEPVVEEGGEISAHVAAEEMLREIERLAEELGGRAQEMPGAEEVAVLSLRERVEAMAEMVLHFAQTNDPLVAGNLPAELVGLPARALREWIKVFRRLALLSGDTEWATVAATAAVLAQRGVP